MYNVAIQVLTKRFSEMSVPSFGNPINLLQSTSVQDIGTRAYKPTTHELNSIIKNLLHKPVQVQNSQQILLSRNTIRWSDDMKSGAFWRGQMLKQSDFVTSTYLQI